MPRPPAIPVPEKARVMLSVLAGDVTVAEAARRAKVSKTTVGNRTNRGRREQRAWHGSWHEMTSTMARWWG